MSTLKELQNKIEEGISKYIEFDVKDIFEQSDYITIYGGAVRDSLAGLDIHDVDILCMPESAYKLRKFLHDEYNYKMLDLFDQDTLNLYKGITLISEPWTLMNDNKKIIQIIRPHWNGQFREDRQKEPLNFNKSKYENDYELAYYNLIKNVDISCCGVFLENKDDVIKLREGCKNAIINCLSKTFEVNKFSKLYAEDRTLYRIHKLESRGWTNINKLSYTIPSFLDNTNNEKRLLQITRLMKVCNLQFEPEYDYQIWTEEEYLHKSGKSCQ